MTERRKLPGVRAQRAAAGSDMRLVLVEWLDAAGGSRSGWKPIADMGRDLPARCRSVGWVVHEDERLIVLVPHLARDGDGDGEIVIPRDWMQRTIELVEGVRGR
ncbi:MAG: hypothetical protein FJX35_04050 [Alphaproteobacteria bacterium]|nr:hypothetical protein [Alphaproteobacteria bacterium]